MHPTLRRTLIMRNRPEKPQQTWRDIRERMMESKLPTVPQDLYDVLPRKLADVQGAMQNRELVARLQAKPYSFQTKRGGIYPAAVMDIGGPSHVTREARILLVWATDTNSLAWTHADPAGEIFVNVWGFLREDGNRIGRPAQFKWNVSALQKKLRAAIIHELVHVLDPKLQKGVPSAETSSSLDTTAAYVKSPHEFDAFTKQLADAWWETVMAEVRKEQDQRIGNNPDASLANAIPHRALQQLRMFLRRPGTYPFPYVDEMREAMGPVRTLIELWRQRPTLWKQFAKRFYHFVTEHESALSQGLEEAETEPPPPGLDEAVVTDIPDVRKVIDAGRGEDLGFGGAAFEEGGKIYAWHVTDKPDEIIRAIRKKQLFFQSYGERGKHNELGPGFYVSGSPLTWVSRARSKWAFLKALTPEQLSRLIDVLAEALEKDKRRLGEGDYTRGLRDLDLVRKGTYDRDVLVGTFANQPYNFAFWKPYWLEKAGIENAGGPVAVRVQLLGRYAELDRSFFDRAHLRTLRRSGLAGAYTRASMGSLPEVVVWHGKNVRFVQIDPVER